MPEWELIETKGGYFFWKYTDSQDNPVYNCTQTNQPPTTEGGYYSYAYLLKVKGLMKGDTIGSLFQKWGRS